MLTRRFTFQIVLLCHFNRKNEISNISSQAKFYYILDSKPLQEDALS